MQPRDRFDGRVRLQFDLKPGVSEQVGVFAQEARGGQFAVGGVEFHAQTVAPVLERGDFGLTTFRLPAVQSLDKVAPKP